MCVEIEKDQYGRSVARCVVDGEDVGGWMVAQGHALDYRHHSAGAYAGEEASARTATRGMHAGTFEPAWEWRSARRNDQPKQAPPRPACAIKGNIKPKAPATITRRAWRPMRAPGLMRRPESAGSALRRRRWRQDGKRRPTVADLSTERRSVLGLRLSLEGQSQFKSVRSCT